MLQCLSRATPGPPRLCDIRGGRPVTRLLSDPWGKKYILFGLNSNIIGGLGTKKVKMYATQQRNLGSIGALWDALLRPSLSSVGV